MTSVAKEPAGISGAPADGGNCNVIVHEALESVAQVPGVDQVAGLLSNHMGYTIPAVGGV